MSGRYGPEATAAVTALYGELDVALVPDIRSGVLHKGTVLAVLMVLGDVVRRRDPQLAAQLMPERCEAAEVRTALTQLDADERRLG